MYDIKTIHLKVPNDIHQINKILIWSRIYTCRIILFCLPFVQSYYFVISPKFWNVWSQSLLYFLHFLHRIQEVVVIISCISLCNFSAKLSFITYSELNLVD